MSLLSTVKKRLGLVADSDVTASSASGSDQGEAAINGLTDLIAVFDKPAADGMAADTTAATKGNGVNGINGSFQNLFEFDLEVVGFSISPNAALTAHDTNFATLNILTDDAIDGAPAAAMSLATTLTAPGSGTWATDILQNVTLPTINAVTKGTQTAANRRLRPGANLFVSIAKSGAGVVVPICSIKVRLRRL